MPNFNIAPFSGNGQDAARWIFKLRRAFRAAGIVGEVSPDMWIGADWSGVEGKAIQWMDSAPHLRLTIHLLRRSPSLLTAEMAEGFTEEFEEAFRMVEQPETPRSPMEMLNELKQGPRETLRNYFAKSQGVLQQLGVNRSNQNDPNTATMRSLLTELLASRFLVDLADGALRSRSIERGAASARTLDKCFNIIRNVESFMIDEKKQLLLQLENWKSQSFDRILMAPNKVKEVLNEFAQKYEHPSRGNPNILGDSNSVAFAEHKAWQLGQSKPPLRALPAPVNHSINYHSENPWRESNRNDPLEQNVGRYRGPEYQGENPWKGESSWYPMKNRQNERTDVGHNADYKGKGREGEISHQQLRSNHPMVSGAIEYRNVCWKCGNGPNADGPRHDNRSCQYPQL